MWLKDRIKYQFLIVLTIVFSLGIVSAPAIAHEFDVYAKVESFTWKEYDDNGSQLLKESGPIYGIGLTDKSYLKTQPQLSFRIKLELFNGKVDYNGRTLAGAPISTDTNYFGYKTEWDLGWKFMPSEKSSIEPFAGLGYRYWIRDIESTTNGIGYTETWQSFYARLGVQGGYNISEDWKTFAEAGVKLPMYNSNSVDYLGVTLEPGKKPSIFAELGTKISLFKASIFYEGMRFSKSSDVYVVTGGSTYRVWQPRSEADMYGLNVGIAF